MKASKILLLTAVILLSFYVQKPGETFQTSFTTETMIEAEAGTINGPVQKYTGREGVSGGSFIMNFYGTSKKLEDPDLQKMPDVSYNLDIPADGDYFLWCRVRVPVEFDEVFADHLSIYVGSDDANYHAAIVKVNTGWEWQMLTNIRYKKGMHTLDLKHKDYGFGIDQIFLTSTGSDLSSLGMSPSYEEILRANFNRINPIKYPALTEKEGLGLDFPKPPPEHPRVFFREKDIADLQKKASHPLMKTAWDKIVKAAGDQTDGLLEAPVDGQMNFTMSTVNSIEAKALMYAFHKDKSVGRNSIEALLNVFNTVKYNPSTSNITRNYGRLIVTNALVYDWCYDLLTDDEKAALIGWAETYAARLEIGWPVIKQGSVTGHASEFQLMRDILSAGIAHYDEKKDMYMLAAGRFFKDYVPSRTIFYPAGYHHQGSAYGGYRYMTELYATALFRGMGYPEIFGKDQRKVPYFPLYSRRPDGQLMRDGDDYTVRRPEAYWTPYGQADLLAASFFKDPVIMGEAMREMKVIGNTDDYIFDFLLVDPGVKTQEPDKLPLSRYFPEPLGAMVARTSWTPGKNSSATVAYMKIGVFQFNNHQHLDGGNFQLYYKGALASESGFYDSYGTDHDYNYHKRTIAHNTILVYDPKEKFGNSSVNDGGQRYANNRSEAATYEILTTRDYKTGDILAHNIGPDPVLPDFTYIKGDLTQAYTAKMKQFHRSFVFLNLKDKEHPAALIVYDKVTSSNKDFEKSWLLHSIEEPVIEGNNTTIRRTQKDYNGKMVNTTLLPDNQNLLIRKIGGPGHEFEIHGVNHPVHPERPLPDPLTTSDESGSWRIEVSPKTAQQNDLFLNVMQVMDDKGGPAPLPVSSASSEEMVGSKISDRIVLFSKTGEQVSGTIGFSFEGNGTYKILLTDLEAGSWNVEVNGRKVSERLLVKKGSGTLYFTGKAGSYKVSRL